MKPAWLYIYIYIYIVYCHLENKKINLQNEKNDLNLEILKLNNKSEDRTMLRLDMDRNLKSVLKNSYFSSIGLSFCAFIKTRISVKNDKHKEDRAGP